MTAMARKIAETGREELLPLPKIPWLSPRLLVWNSSFGVVALVVAIGDAFGSRFDLSRAGAPPYLVQNLLFLNTLHVVFTYLLVELSPESSTRFEKTRARFRWMPAAVVVASIFTLLAFLNADRSPLGMQAAFYIALIAPAFHSLAQHKGLCLDALGQRAAARFARPLWRAAIPVFLLTRVALHFTSIPDAKLVAAVVCAVVFIPLTVVSISSLERPWSAAGLFQLRLLLVPLSVWSDLAGFFIACLHGVEYTSVFFSQVPFAGLWRQKRPLTIAIPAFMAVAVATWFVATAAPGSTLARVSMALLMSVTIAHYGLDGFLFRSPKFYQAVPKPSHRERGLAYDRVGEPGT